MRVALISDLHGNELALRATLADIARAGADRIVCLGDVATLGPRPREVLALLRGTGCDCIMGNHDSFMLDAALIHTYTEAQVVVDAVDWCRDRLTEDDLAFVRTFQSHLTIPLDGGASLLAFHGSPRSNMEDILCTTPAEQLEAMLEGHAATVMAGGHTHFQMLRQHRGTLLVNPGSVGIPFKEFTPQHGPTLMSHAEYATVEAHGRSVSVNLRRVELDRAELRRIAGGTTGHPLRSSWLKQYS